MARRARKTRSPRPPRPANGAHSLREQLPVELSAFDLGLARDLINFDHRLRMSDSGSATERSRSDFDKWVVPCGGRALFEKGTSAAGALRLGRFVASLGCNGYTSGSVGRGIADHFGRDAELHYELGQAVWTLAMGPLRQGRKEHATDLLRRLNIDEAVLSPILQFAKSHKSYAEPSPAQVLKVVQGVRDGLVEWLAKFRAEAFISHSHRDNHLAEELTAEFEKEGVSCFLAPRDIPSGDAWVEDIRSALVRCKELLAIVTPNSKTSAWLMVEAGAAWVLGKTLNIGYAYVELEELPAILTRSQAVNIETASGRARLVEEVCSRLAERKPQK